MDRQGPSRPRSAQREANRVRATRKGLDEGTVNDVHIRIDALAHVFKGALVTGAVTHRVPRARSQGRDVPIH
jgi:hypothetical protein